MPATITSLYVIQPLDVEDRCKDYDEDCMQILHEGYCLSCWQYDPSRGICPFVGN